MISEGTRSTWTTVALVVSCMVNLFLGGVVAGIATGRLFPLTMHFRPPHLSADMADVMVNKLVSGMNERDQQTIRDAFAIGHADLIDRLDAARLAKVQVQEALRAEPFDPSQFDAALQNLDSKMSAMPRMFQRLMVEVAPRVSVESRRHLADRFSHMAPP